jgi:murein tripeptide amidase MpaA
MTRRWPSYAEIEAQLQQWQRQHPARLTLRDLGRTAAGRTLWGALVSDEDADPEQQEHVLLTANHSGARERTATTGVLYVLRWLLSDDPLAAAVRRRQLVACMPVGVPDSYEGDLGATNAAGLSPCNDWTLDGPCDPQRSPEGVAVQQLMDRLQNEVHSDFHGLDLAR